jgi:hypothetical protein
MTAQLNALVIHYDKTRQGGLTESQTVGKNTESLSADTQSPERDQCCWGQPRASHVGTGLGSNTGLNFKRGHTHTHHGEGYFSCALTREDLP